MKFYTLFTSTNTIDTLGGRVDWKLLPNKEDVLKSLEKRGYIVLNNKEFNAVKYRRSNVKL